MKRLPKAAQPVSGELDLNTHFPGSEVHASFLTPFFCFPITVHQTPDKTVLTALTASDYNSNLNISSCLCF